MPNCRSRKVSITRARKREGEDKDIPVRVQNLKELMNEGDESGGRRSWTSSLLS